MCDRSWINRWHTDSQQCSEPRPQNAPTKAISGQQDYHKFEAPLLTMLLVLALQALTDCATKTVMFLNKLNRRSIQLNMLNRLMAHWQSTVLRTAAANCTNESDWRPTGLPRIWSAVADYAASACITGVNWLCDKNILVSILKIYLFWGPVLTVRPMRCFVSLVIFSVKIHV